MSCKHALASKPVRPRKDTNEQIESGSNGSVVLCPADEPEEAGGGELEGERVPEEPGGDGGEARVPRVLWEPGQPTCEEVREHNVIHLPYRAWCRHCVLWLCGCNGAERVV